MIVDDVVSDRIRIRDSVLEQLDRPLDPEGAREFDEAVWARKNIEAMARMGIGADDDPHLAQPVVHPPRPGVIVAPPLDQLTEEVVATP